MKKIISIVLVVFMLTLSLAACGGKDNSAEKGSGIKLTEAEIRSELAENSGTLTIEGESDNVTSFTFVVNNVNASNLVNKEFTREAVNVLLTNSSKIPYGQLKACNGFNAVMAVCGLFEEDEGDFDANAFTETVLSIICNNQKQTYENWTVSATVNTADDSITVSAVSK